MNNPLHRAPKIPCKSPVLWHYFLSCSVSHLCQCGVLSADNSVITLKVLPTLVRLCKTPGDVPVNTQAAHTLGKGSASGHGLHFCLLLPSPPSSPTYRYITLHCPLSYFHLPTLPSLFPILFRYTLPAYMMYLYVHMYMYIVGTWPWLGCMSCMGECTPIKVV